MSLRVARQLLVLGVTLALWASSGRLELLAALLSYLLAVAMLATPPLRALLGKLSPAQVACIALVLAAPGLAFVVRGRAELADAEGLHGLSTSIADRLRLERLPAVAPPLVASDRAQTFFVLAPDARHVQVRLGARARPIRGEALGEGLFRVDYEPRRDGLPWPANGPLTATLTVDGHSTTRELQAHTQLAHPRWLALSPDGNLAATVSEETDELIVVDRNGLRLRAQVGDAPSDCLFLDDTRVVVSHLDEHTLRTIALEDGRTLSTLALPARARRLALSPDRRLLAVALTGSTPAIAFVDPEHGRLREQLSIAASPDWLAFGEDERTLLVTTQTPAQVLRLRRTESGYQTDVSLPLVRPAVTLARSREGRHVMLAVTDYEPHGRALLGNHFIQDQLLGLNVESMQVDGQWLTARRTARQTKPGDVDRGLSPMGLSEAADGTWLVSFAGSDEVWRRASASVAPATVDLVETVLHAPHGVAELTGGTLVVTSPSAGALGLFAPGATQPKLVRLTPDDAQLLARDRESLARRVGERGFYESTRSGISCQSCHLHASSDGALHNLGGKRLVPTLSVRGLLGSAPYLRDGSYPTLADLDEVAQTLYRGYLRSQGARGETLEAYVSSLPRERSARLPTARDPAQERRGLKAFVKARCPSCHTPPAFTNLGVLPMHTLFPDEAARRTEGERLDTPSLLSVSASPPYLHDGRAPTLDSVLSQHNRRNLHGDTASLSDDERHDLVGFLESL